jgi:uncharacterized protein (TIGR03085 family)
VGTVPVRAAPAYHHGVTDSLDPGQAGRPLPPARVERLALCDLMLRLGPDVPTQCAGWTTGDLAAHLLVREHRPDTAPGLVIRRLAGLTERVRRRAKETIAFPDLVGRVRQGPPRWSVYALPGVDSLVNTVEYFVHHEDVLRSQPGWAPRELPDAVEDLLWRRLRAARFIMRKVPAEVTLVRLDGRTFRVSKGGKRARVHGPVGELVLWVHGRTDVAQVRFTGEADAVEALGAADWGA